MRINKPESSGPRPGVLIVLLAVALTILTLWYREGDAGVVHRVRAGVHTVSAPLSATGEWVTRPVRGFFAWAGDLGTSRSQLEQLRAQNERLRARLAELEEARLENERLKGLVDFTETAKLESVGARVIGRPTNSWEGVISIDRGSDDGVSNGMPVVGPLGLLGQTVAVAPGSAKVRLITDQRSGVAAMVQRTRAPGIVRGSIEGALSLDFVGNNQKVRVGDVVITSGIGGVYPKGIVIGEVVSAKKDSAGLYQKIELEPASDLTGLEEVLVLTNTPEPLTPQGGE